MHYCAFMLVVVCLCGWIGGRVGQWSAVLTSNL